MKLSLCLIALLLGASVHANSTREEALKAQAELRQFKLSPGFTIALVASEEGGVVKPIDLTFDDAGRLWTQTASMYPLDPEGSAEREQYARDLYQGRARGKDKVLIIPDPHKPSPSKPLVWAQELAIPQSILPYKNGAYVAHGSELLFLEDTDADGKADRRRSLLSGFGITDTHTLPHALVRAPGGWIHFSHGALNKGEVVLSVSGAKLWVEYSKILRMSEDGARFNLVSSGLNNIWGFQLRANGQWYGTEANDLGWSVAPMEEGTGFEGIGSDRIRPYQPWLPPLHKFRVGGTGISGLAFAEDRSGSFPEKWRDVAFLANPITSAINAVRIVRNADGTVTAEHMPDFLTAEDNWFRPVNMEFGPDGCLYVADWYNKIISHNEVALDHPGRDKSRGRIWRVCHESQKPRPIPNLYRVRNAQLVTHLQSPSLWEKRAAWHQIVDRNAKELAPRLVKLAQDRAQDPITRIHALWSLEGVKHYDEPLMRALLSAPEDDLRREAVRALGSFSLPSAVLAHHLRLVMADRTVMVRSQVLRTLHDSGRADDATIDILVAFCRPDSSGNSLGGDYERKFERYLARMALEKYPAQLMSYLRTEQAEKRPVSHLFWATQALPFKERATQFLALWPQIQTEPLDQAGFIALAQLVEESRVREAVKSYFDAQRNAAPLAQLASSSYASAQSVQMGELLQSPVRSLLAREEKAYANLGLEVASKYDVPGIRDAVIAVLRSDRADESTVSLALAALDRQEGVNKALLSEVLARKDISFALRVRALMSLAKVDPAAVQAKLEAELPKLDSSQRKFLISEFSQSAGGADSLLQLLERKVLNYDDFDLSAASRVFGQRKQSPGARALVDEIWRREQQRKEATQRRLEHLVQLAARQRGNSASGAQFFGGVCLACHAVGGAGAGFAPALDGSGHRDNMTLLTSILDPDAAVESSYLMYIIVKRDGSSLEGYMKQKNERGTTLQFMGGGEIFVDKSEIQSEGFHRSRSFMPPGLVDSLSDEQVEDLLAYIRTLK